MWKKLGQLELIRECFAHARQANPQATLLINDYCTRLGTTNSSSSSSSIRKASGSTT